MGMGWGLGENPQVIIPGGCGFRRGLLDGSLRPDVGHASDPMWSALIGLLARV
ncbi:hypothetical protein Hanom_Chr14g01263611 [Helianthus anomalus]